MLAIIPARGGSKGIPRKNIRDIGGLPLIAHAIRAARQAEGVTGVLVSTEDEEIADIARAHGADVPFLRPAELATDTAPNSLACLHAFDRMMELSKTADEAFILMQPTTPFTRVETVDAAIAKFRDRKPGGIITIASMEHPIEAVFERAEDDTMRNVLRWRYGATFTVGVRQAYGERYRVTGGVCILRPDRIRANPRYLHTDPDIIGLPVADIEGVDIDTPLDLAFARFLMDRGNAGV